MAKKHFIAKRQFSAEEIKSFEFFVNAETLKHEDPMAFVMKHRAEILVDAFKIGMDGETLLNQVIDFNLPSICLRDLLRAISKGPMDIDEISLNRLIQKLLSKVRRESPSPERSAEICLAAKLAHREDIAAKFDSTAKTAGQNRMDGAKLPGELDGPALA